MTSSGDLILKVSNLSIKKQDEVILDDISFEVRRGMTLAVVGPNGAGKSTLFKALLNLVPYTGKIEWFGKAKIGYIPQSLSLQDIPISVEEFLAFKKKYDARDYLKSVELDRKVVSSKLLSVLSGGELQRVLIAWSIIDEPNVLLFDEPTSGIDVGSAEIVYDMLKKVQRQNNITILLIAHDLHVIRDYSDYILAINKKLLFFGESRMITDPSLLSLIFGGSAVMFEKTLGK